MTTASQQRFVLQVLGLYCDTPGTSGKVRPADRYLANTLYLRGIPISTIRAAMLLVAARRTFRALDAEPLKTIRSLHYFQHAIQEILDEPLPDGYIDYLCWKLAPLPPSLAASDQHQIT